MMVKGAKALEVWCRRVTDGYPGVDISNMTTSWKDGLAFCAILHRYRPDKIDFHSLDRRDIKGNNSLAFRVAEETFGIPSLLDPDDMAKCVAPDRLSILTYVSEYYHRLKNLQPVGSPLIRAVKEQPITKLSRASSTSSGVTSMSSSCESSSSSVCDSPPPTASDTAGRDRKSEQTPMTEKPKTDTLTTEQLKEKLTISEEVLEDKKAGDAKSTVVMRRGNDAQKRALATRRRLVQSMIVESSSSMSSLCSPSPSPPSPAIEKENPFREAMMKFVAMEKKDDNSAASKKAFSTKSTETTTPSRNSKSTQTSSPSFLGSGRTRDENKVAFKTCLRTQLSCPANSASSGARPRAPSAGPLSYTSTPRPYSSQSMVALNKAASSIPSSPQNYPQQPPQQQQQQQQLVHARPEQPRATVTPAHRRPLSMLANQGSPEYRISRTPQHTPALPGATYTPGIHQEFQNRSYSSSYLSSSPGWSPNNSIFLTPSANGSPSSGYSSSVYSTPVGVSPCRRFASGSSNNSPARYRPSSAVIMRHDHLQLHIEGQSSLV